MRKCKSWLMVFTCVSLLVLAVDGMALAEWYKVQAGDTLWSIARKHNMELDTLLMLNHIHSNAVITPGMQLVVNDSTELPGRVHIVKAGETLFSIAKGLGMDYHELQRYNNLADASKIYPGMELKIPGGAVTSQTMTRFQWPSMGTVTSRFGNRWGRQHNGVDISLKVGSPVEAAAAGKVIKAEWNSGYGKMIVIDHGDGLKTLYAHNSEFLVKSDEMVGAGQIIALSGNTGRSTGPHLHFEVLVNDTAVDPETYLP